MVNHPHRKKESEAARDGQSVRAHPYCSLPVLFEYNWAVAGACGPAMSIRYNHDTFQAVISVVDEFGKSVTIRVPNGVLSSLGLAGAIPNTPCAPSQVDERLEELGIDPAALVRFLDGVRQYGADVMMTPA